MDGLKSKIVDMEPLGVAPKAGFRVIGCGVTKGYQLINSGDLQIYKIGRATRITVESLKAYVAKQVAAHASRAA